MLARSAPGLALVALAGVALPAQPPASPTAPAPTIQAAQPPARSPRNASYTITARLDPASRALTGEQLLTWRNTSAVPATTLQFHLYYNAWRNTRSTGMRELARGGDTEALERPASDWGWIDVTSLKLVRPSGCANACARLFCDVANKR